MEEQGQAQEQPISELASQVATQIIESEDPRKKPAEAPAEQAQETSEQPTEEAHAEETSEEPSIELDLEAKLFEVEETREGGVKEKVKYSAKELMAQRMMQADYQRKTAELAREREAVKELVKQQTEPVVSQYQQKLEIFERAVWHSLAPDIQNTDWNKLAIENPAEWAAKRQAVENVTSILQSIEAEKQELANQAKAKLLENQQKQIQLAKEILQKDIPGWSDETYLNIRKAGVDYGYTLDEVNQVTDARAIKVLHDAMKYRALQAAKPSVEKKVLNVPKVLKPGSAEKPDPNRETLNKAKAQLKKTGRQEDAIAFARLLVS